MAFKIFAQANSSRGFTSVECDQASDEYYNSRSLRSRLGAWASLQSKPLDHEKHC